MPAEHPALYEVIHVYYQLVQFSLISALCTRYHSHPCPREGRGRWPKVMQLVGWSQDLNPSPLGPAHSPLCLEHLLCSQNMAVFQLDIQWPPEVSPPQGSGIPPLSGFHPQKKCQVA